MISIYLLHVHENPGKGKRGEHSMKVWVEVCRRGFQTLTLLIFTAILPKQLYKAHTPCIHYLRERRHIVHWLLHMCLRPCTIALLALRSMAPFGWFNFSLPSLFHPTLSRVFVSHPEEAARFPRPILNIGKYDLLTVIGSCF